MSKYIRDNNRHKIAKTVLTILWTSDVGNTMSKHLLLMHMDAEGYSYYIYDTLGCV